MTTQAQRSLFDTPETVWRRDPDVPGVPVFAPPTPREIGEERAQASEDKAVAELAFDPAKAAEDLLAWLLHGGQASGEEIVDYLKSIGHRPHDDRAFGAIFGRLSRAGLISFVGYAIRKKGHATGGARVWKAVAK